MKKIALMSVALVLVTACGSDVAEPAGSAQPAGEPRVVDVSMTDMAFAPAALDVAAGETITFVFRNDGAVRHEAAVGDMSQQEEHHAEMAEGSGEHDMESMDMESMDTESMDHGDEAMATEMHGVVVEPGETVELTHTFGTAGSMIVGCHEPGHWEAGMRLDVTVT